MTVVCLTYPPARVGGNEWHRALRRLGAAIAGLALSISVRAAGIPSFTELEAAGARIGTIRILPRNIFDTEDPKEGALPFRLANALHIRTRPEVIERALLFASGEVLSARLIDETERLLRESKYLYDVQILPAAVRDGVVDIDVVTRDSWTIEPGVSVGRSGGANTSSVGVKDDNFLGTGIALGFSRSNGVDRSGTQLDISNPRAFGTWTAVSLTTARNSDGRRNAASAIRPFYELDARWAAGVSASMDDRIDSLYESGSATSSYRRRENSAEAFAGVSAGLIGGWVQRWSVGVQMQDDGYRTEPGLSPPSFLPGNEKLVAPFVRYELIEDHFEKTSKRNLVGRPEFFALGLRVSLQIGRSASTFGSDRSAWLYEGEISRGFELPRGQLITSSASAVGHYEASGIHRARLGTQVRYYRPQSARWLFYASAAADVLRGQTPVEVLTLGGDNGLRGYPLRYLNGRARALITVEERFYTDLFPLRLFRVGGAAFFDAGRIWGNSSQRQADGRWLSNLGLGLRFFSVRTAFANVLHIDIAMPLQAEATTKQVQFLVKTKATF